MKITVVKRLGCLLLAMCLSGVGVLAFAEEADVAAEEKAEITVAEEADVAVEEEAKITVAINGQLLETEVPPIIVEGRTMVPMRAIFEALGADVDWIGA